jgi:hypothetical protein
LTFLSLWLACKKSFLEYLMNINKAKKIPLSKLFDILGYNSVEREKHKHWKNGIEFISSYLKSQRNNHTRQDALRWIETMCGYGTKIQPIADFKPPTQHAKLIVKDTEPLYELSLVRYLKQRGIPLDLAAMHLEEVNLYNPETKKRAFAIGFKNEVNGYEIFNKFFEGHVGKRNISFIRGTAVKPDGIHIFKDIFDYLSAVMYEQNRKFKNDSLILNSWSCLELATPYIKGYGYKEAYTWLSNDIIGREATKNLADFFKTEESLIHLPMNAIYIMHRSINDWHISRHIHRPEPVKPPLLLSVAEN